MSPDLPGNRLLIQLKRCFLNLLLTSVESPYLSLSLHIQTLHCVQINAAWIVLLAPRQSHTLPYYASCTSCRFNIE